MNENKIRIKRSKAQRLADALNCAYTVDTTQEAAAELRRLDERETELAARLGETIPALEEAAAELDRLHELNAELVEALRDIVEWTERYTAPGHPISTVGRAALAKAEGK